MRQHPVGWWLTAILLCGASAAASAQAVPPSPPAQTPAAAAPGGAPQPGGVAPGQAGGTPATQPGVAPPVQGRVFTGSTGLVFNAVRTERVADFERALSYFQAALDKSTDPGIRAQAKGWRILKAAEPGPNGTVLYVFLIDPTVPKADYSLGPILAEAYPDPAELQQIWKLYTSAVTSGGSLLNLAPVMLPAPTGPLTIPAAPAGAAAPGPPATLAPATPAR